MKAVRNVKVGDLVQVPVYCFAPMRSGWNGWIFRVGIVDKLFISTKGRKCATVRYCTATADRYTLLPCTEYSRNYTLDHVFQYDGLERQRQWYQEGLQCEKNGEQVCWDQDIALLLNNGFLD